VIAEATRRSALAGYADRFAEISTASNGQLAIREIPFLTQINLRANPAEADTIQAFNRTLGFDLPLEANTVSSKGERSALWLGADEWVIVAPPDQQRSIEAALHSALGGAGAVVDVSANRTVIEVRGWTARDLLAHGCAIDLDSRAFGPDRCAQTLLAKAQVILQQTALTPAFRIYVRASFAAYLADWLLDATSGPATPRHRSIP